MEKAHRDVRWLAWHIEALARAKSLPSFMEMMGEKPKAQDPDDMLIILEKWANAHNAKLSAQERNADVVEV